MPHVTIDRDGCISCGTCWLECPDVFEENPADAKSQVVERYRGGAGTGGGRPPGRARRLCPAGGRRVPRRRDHGLVIRVPRRGS